MWWKILLIYLAIMNIVAFLTYGLDKWKAKKDKWRVPEKVLLLMAAVGGSIGAFLGMRIFHHKTQKWKFKLGVPVIFLLQVALVVFILLKVKGLV